MSELTTRRAAEIVERVLAEGERRDEGATTARVAGLP